MPTPYTYDILELQNSKDGVHFETLDIDMSLSVDQNIYLVCRGLKLDGVPLKGLTINVLRYELDGGLIQFPGTTDSNGDLIIVDNHRLIGTYQYFVSYPYSGFEYRNFVRIITFLPNPVIKEMSFMLIILLILFVLIVGVLLSQIL